MSNDNMTILKMSARIGPPTEDGKYMAILGGSYGLQELICAGGYLTWGGIPVSPEDVRWHAKIVSPTKEDAAPTQLPPLVANLVNQLQDAVVEERRLQGDRLLLTKRLEMTNQQISAAHADMRRLRAELFAAWPEAAG